MFLTYQEFADKLNRIVALDQAFYLDLLQKIVKYPNRYTGIFRVSSTKTKLIQNVTQSREIKFGDFMEVIVTDYLTRLGYKNLDKHLGQDEEGNTLLADQLFEDKDRNIYLVEQKIRDDHDSTKKRGQFLNFVKKIKLLTRKYPNSNIIASMWFIDDGLVKNKNYYLSEMSKFTLPQVTNHLYYGGEIFSQLLNTSSAWEEIVSYLQKNKDERQTEVIAIADFDTSPEVYQALLQLNKSQINKLNSPLPQYEQLRKELFPTGANLNKLLQLQLHQV